MKMEEEISRILKMLEEGRIDAEAAERLIRAVHAAPEAPRGRARRGEAGENASRTEDVRDFFDAPFPVFEDILRAARRTAHRIARHGIRRHWWRHFRLHQWYESRRRHRAVSMTPLERICFVLSHAASDPGLLIAPESSVHTLLREDPMAWDLALLGLRFEFQQDISMQQLREASTVGDLLLLVEGTQTPGGAAPDRPQGESQPAASGPEPTAGAGDAACADWVASPPSD